MIGNAISNLPVSTVENSVILTFCHKKKKKMIIDVMISTLKRHWIFLGVEQCFAFLNCIVTRAFKTDDLSRPSSFLTNVLSRKVSVIVLDA